MLQKALISAFLLCLGAWGQTPQVPSPPVPTLPPPPVQLNAAPIQNWAGAFMAYNVGASPKVSGGFSEASLVSSSAQLYSFSTWDVSVVKIAGVFQYQSTPRTGLAMVLRTFGPVSIVGFGNMGVSTASNKVSLATSGGGVAIVKLGKTNWTVFGGYHVLDTGAQGGTRAIPEFGVGRTF